MGAMTLVIMKKEKEIVLFIMNKNVDNLFIYLPFKIPQSTVKCKLALQCGHVTDC